MCSCPGQVVPHGPKQSCCLGVHSTTDKGLAKLPTNTLTIIVVHIFFVQSMGQICFDPTPSRPITVIVQETMLLATVDRELAQLALAHQTEINELRKT